MLLDSALQLARQRRVLFMGGKGGTGKTSLASGLALARARDGARVLLVSTDPAHNLGHIWSQKLGDQARPVYETGRGGVVDAIEIDPSLMVKRHFAQVENMMRQMLPESQHKAAHQHLASARKAPGSQESATLERIAQIIQRAPQYYDLVVFDTAPTGHTLHLLALPSQLTTWAENLLANRDRSERFSAAARSLVGKPDETSSQDADLRRRLLARRDRFEHMHKVITDAQTSGFIVVALAEKLPMAESMDLVRQLQGLHINVTSVIINRRSPADAGALMAARHQREADYIQQMRHKLGGINLLEIPLLAHELVGAQALEALADQLATSVL